VTGQLLRTAGRRSQFTRALRETLPRYLVEGHPSFLGWRAHEIYEKAKQAAFPHGVLENWLSYEHTATILAARLVSSTVTEFLCDRKSRVVTERGT
jgi:hypothetical protein